MSGHAADSSLATGSLLTEWEGSVLVVTLNRPHRLNAFDWDLHEAFATLMGDVSQDKRTRVVVITGAGRAFSAGGDTELMYEVMDQRRERGEVIQAGGRLLKNLINVRQPVIAMVNGPAVGLGATIALHADVVFAAATATFSDPHVQMGLVAGDGGAVIWPLLLGPNRAKQYLMTGDPVDAREADRLGLVNAVIADSDLREHTLRFARRLASGPQAAIEGTKAAINKHLRVWAELVLPESLGLEGLSMLHPDHARRVTEFREKRFKPF